MKRTIGLTLGVALLAGLMAACGGGAKQPSVSTPATQPAARPELPTAKVEGKIVVYSSASKELLDKMGPALKAKHPDLDVQLVYGGTEELVDKLNAEIAAGNVMADAIMVGDPAYARLLKSQGLLLPYVPAGADKVTVDRDPEGYYTAVRGVDVVLIYNTEKVKKEDAPKSFKDLLDPKWKGQVSFSDPTKSGTSFVTVGALVQTYGWEYFKTAQDNAWQFGGGSSTPVKKVSTGDATIGVAVESSTRTEMAKGAKMDIVWPADGAIFMPSPYAILKSTKNAVGAKAVADWLMTGEAQSMVAKANMQPVISGIPAPDGSRALDVILKDAMKVDWARLAKEKGEIQDKFLQTVKVAK